MRFFVFNFRPDVKTGLQAASLLLMSSLLIATGCKKSSVAGAPPSLEVAVATAEQRDVPIYGEWVGNLDGFVNAQIQPQVSGYLIRQDYHEGQQVHKGQVLFEIDERPFQAALDQAQGQLAQARAQLELSRINVRRDQPLVAAHALAQSQLDNDTQQAAQYAAVVQSDEASVRTAELNLGWTKVRSLVDGVAGKAVMQVGNLVSTTTALTTVSQVNPIKAYFAISEQEYLNLSDSAKRQGVTDLLRVGSKIPLELSLSNGQVYPQKGTIVFVDRGVDNTTGTIMVAGAFLNSSNLLRPGQYAKVRALTNVQKNAILVPQRAVMDQQGQHLVVVVGPNNMTETRIVTVGSQVGSDWIITSGIRAGDRVVTEGNGKIRGPMPVRPVAEQATAQGGR
ncbi:efflux RND transporter periplasmic adaptor subunit [Telmatobacter bradus]|uniref:efflux RND transporter periplasmic adaptor subunit n=1 Tax=Telmatobacter bradus TaxID=474953 RepID=UPI003B43B22E